MKYLITGTGRCGTGFMSHFFSSAGIKCTHEKIFTLQGWDYAKEQIDLRMANPSWGWEAESSWLAVPFLPEVADYLTIIHIVRHPKKVIDSMARLYYDSDPYYNWMLAHLLELNDWHTLADKCACWYLNLNKLIEPYANIRHKVEDNPVDLLDKLKIDCKGKELYSDTNYNSRVGNKPSDILLQDISKSLREPLAEMSSRYGYEWPEKRLRDPFTWHSDHFNNVLFGLSIMQSGYDLAVWERAIDFIRPKTVIELGTYKGALSVYLFLLGERYNFDFKTYDKKSVNNPLFEYLRELSFKKLDVFSDEMKSEITDVKRRPLLLLCDNGNKPKEFDTFLPLLESGDYIAVHDWEIEIGLRHINKWENRIEPILWDECRKASSLLRFWRVY